MVKINSELPLTMLEHNLKLNDIDFVLFHLYKQYPEYARYYKNLRRGHPERIMILDNSAYEFFVKGEKLDLDEFAGVVAQLGPTYYICPDVLMDAEQTRNLTDKFYREHGYRLDMISQPLVVAQGSTEDEMFEMLMYYYNEGFENVAIPFHNSFFKEDYLPHDADRFRCLYNNLTDDHRYALGRIHFIRKSQLLLKKFSYVHLLGSHCPFEKALYKDDIVKSMDTGYPVKCAIMGYKLFTEPAKPDIIIDDFMTTQLTSNQQELIIENIKRFKNIYPV